MKVLLCIRGDYMKSFAGDSKIVLMTAKYLRRLGVEVDINDGYISDYSSYDIVHLFNLTRMGETYKYYKQAHRQKKIIVTTPIYGNLKKYYEYRSQLDNIKLWERTSLYREEILKGSNMVLPNSELEKQKLSEDFGINMCCSVIPHGVEIEHDETPLYNLKARYNLNNYVLCVARIHPQKNQLKLAKACSKLGVNLVLIGNINDKTYYNECINYKNVVYLGFMDSYHIYNAYRFSKLHVLPSFMEIPGLSSLEAAASGCNIASTSEGSAEEYFKDYALYLNPYDEESIANVIEAGLKQRKSSKLKNHVLENHSWEKCISQLYGCYNKLLSETVK
ncbi:glycosyltransferase family 4 protein [Clostridium swellfunianum]|uniref:glycosyltransferase family 4 protein n=1 Tax=Clostridium swellfunianum TaxID=1367462 RepID=UPI00202DF2D0|nr:glycosyltransferase family 4 protein [Clostridium swellfunianum]MCM0650606.1 glycosyltransferase family 4 protein [Clostridium swellfunianum]